MSPEKPLSQVRQDYARSWARIEPYLPTNLSEHYRNFVRDYFRDQLRIVKGCPTKAGRILSGLDNRAGFTTFEWQNQPLLAAIDFAVRGSSNRRDPDTKQPIEPAFRINHDK